MNVQNTKLDKTLEITCWLIIAVLATIILKNLAFLFVPFSIAILFCYALGIPLEYLKRFHVPSSIRIILAVVLVIGAIYLFGRLVQTNLLAIGEQLPIMEERFWQYSDSLLEKFSLSRDEAKEIVAGFLNNLNQQDLKPLGSVLTWLSGSFFSFLGNMFWVILFMAFVLAEKNSFAQKIVAGMGDEKSGKILSAIEKVNQAVQQYLGLKTVISLITGVLVGLSLLVLQVPFAFLWGVAAFLLNFIPNIGSLAAGIPPIAVTLFVSGSIGRTFAVVAVFALIQLVMGNVVEPKIMGKGLNLSPLTVLLALLFWGWLWGIPGMLLSVPLTAAVKIGLEQIDSTKPLALLLSSEANT